MSALSLQAVRAFHAIGAPITEHFLTLGLAARLFIQMPLAAKAPPARRHEIFLSVVHLGVESLPIIAIATAAAGLVVTQEIGWHMNMALGTVNMIPAVTGQFVLRELGIAIPALLLVAKVGASIAAEIGTMTITEQVDALKLLKIDPVHYLVLPRFVASVLSTLCLTLVSIAVTLSCAVWVAVFKFGFTWLEYVNALRQFVTITDLIQAGVKAAVFGAVIPLISCAYGLRCKGGAEGVGTATTNAVVASTVSVITLDFILTALFTLLFS